MGVPITNGGTVEATDFIGTRRKTISPASFHQLWNDTNFGNMGYYCSPIAVAAAEGICGIDFLPDGCKINKLKVYWDRNDALATGVITLTAVDKTNYSAGGSVLANADSNASTGEHSVETTLGTPHVVDNTKYHYYLDVVLTPNDNNTDVRIVGAELEIEIDNPKP